MSRAGGDSDPPATTFFRSHSDYTAMGSNPAEEITLTDMLNARDRRVMRQKQLVDTYPDCTPVVLTVVAPGKEKRNRNTAVVAAAAADALADAFAGLASLWQICDLPTGFELWIAVRLDPLEAKRRACAIEECHPLGRLMDIDVIGEDLHPVSRSAIGLPGRGCLVCGDNARICMRAGRHSYADLLKKISDTVDSYVATV